MPTPLRLLASTVLAALWLSAGASFAQNQTGGGGGGGAAGGGGGGRNGTEGVGDAGVHGFMIEERQRLRQQGLRPPGLPPPPPGQRGIAPVEEGSEFELPARRPAPRLVERVPPPPRALPPATQGGGAPRVTLPGADPSDIVPDELVLTLRGTPTAQRLAAVLRAQGLEPIETQRITLIGHTVVRARIGGGRTSRQALQALARDGRFLAAQPNFIHRLPSPAIRNAQSGPSLAASGTAAAGGGIPQYALAKLGIEEAHRISRGEQVRIAVIDSGVDATHPELAGVIESSFDTVSGQPVRPEDGESHGTGMASAIFAHAMLKGVAPQALLLTARAFAPPQPGASGNQGTSFQVLKGLDWAVAQRAKVLNLSFAGPRDPVVGDVLAAAVQRGAIPIAAAGNAGPASPPLFPASDPNVIAVTGLDEGNRVFAMANRGRHIAVAAPGVDVLVAQPQAGYGLTTGTSVATAHVSGVVALMAARDPGLTLARARAILAGTASDLGAPGPDAEFGAGLVNPRAALSRLPQARPLTN